MRSIVVVVAALMAVSCGAARIPAPLPAPPIPVVSPPTPITVEKMKSLVPVPVICKLVVQPVDHPYLMVWGDTGSWCQADFSAAFEQLKSGTWRAVVDEATNSARALPVP